jgi:hypothetical protein
VSRKRDGRWRNHLLDSQQDGQIEKERNRSDLEARGYRSPPNQRSRLTGNKVLPEASYFYHRMKFAKIILDGRSRKNNPPWSL